MNYTHFQVFLNRNYNRYTQKSNLYLSDGTILLEHNGTKKLGYRKKITIIIGQKKESDIKDEHCIDF